MGFWHIYMGIYGGGTAPVEPDEPVPCGGWVAGRSDRVWTAGSSERVWLSSGCG